MDGTLQLETNRINFDQIIRWLQGTRVERVAVAAKTAERNKILRIGPGPKMALRYRCQQVRRRPFWFFFFFFWCSAPYLPGEIFLRVNKDRWRRLFFFLLGVGQETSWPARRRIKERPPGGAVNQPTLETLQWPVVAATVGVVNRPTTSESKFSLWLNSRRITLKHLEH